MEEQVKETNVPKKLKGTSPVPMIMGIIGFVFGIPGILCAGICAAATASVGSGAGTIWLIITIIAALGGLVFGLMAKSQPKLAGILLIMVAVLSLLITFFSFSIWALFMFICFLIGGIIAVTQKTEEVA
jgi:hypothetical protein